jgi:hypothetical protein
MGEARKCTPNLQNLAVKLGELSVHAEEVGVAVGGLGHVGPLLAPTLLPVHIKYIYDFLSMEYR